MVNSLASIGIFASCFGVLFMHQEAPLNSSLITGSIEEVKRFFDSEQNDLSVNYESYYHEKWNPGFVDFVYEIKSFDSDEFCGYVVDFQHGYLAYSLDYVVYEVASSGEPFPAEKSYYELWQSTVGTFVESDFFDLKGAKHPFDASIIVDQCGDSLAEHFFKIDQVTTFNNFSLSYCLCPITFLKEHYPAANFGNYIPLSVEQGGINDCAACAFADWIYTYKLSNVVDLTAGKKPNEIREMFKVLAHADSEGFIAVSNIEQAMNQYIASLYKDNAEAAKYIAVSGDRGNPFKPIYVVFQKGNEAHAAITIGSGISDHWWVFKTHWVVVLTWDKNYLDDDHIYWQSYGDATGVYVIDELYYKYDWSLAERTL